MKSQWDCVLQNLGKWQGSFTRLSPLGEEIEDIPSLISLTGVNEDLAIHLALTRHYPDADGVLQPQEMAFDFSEPSAGAIFFETGAFSEGSPYLRLGAPSGAEFAFRHEDRRLRLIPQFDANGCLFRLTLIREGRVGTDAPERPPLKLAGWLGVWQGKAVTLYPGNTQVSESPTIQTTTMTDDRTLVRSQSIGSQVTESTFTIDTESDRTRLTTRSTQVILLPDAAYVLCPTQIESGVEIALEVGWSIAPNLRQRLIRTYIDRGEWLSLTFITESRSG
ncbi:DUF3598 family protein [Chamaesiphon sp. VAR_69_metabat_338]|uniref:DUF3598 family protein n=1 Tax=Chamaesiphon sp. VAR_69_metabat_338 TaxID=2964704 RepID=UPI00286E13FA|nr:DUF3598 family protein [Chamaesiphon sp. VAR_69_metabat_338]